jgi:hypothetical protein
VRPAAVLWAYPTFPLFGKCLAQVFLDSVAGTSPLAIRALCSLEPSPHGSCAERVHADLVVCEGGNGNQPASPRQGRDDEPVEVVENGPRDELPKRAVVPLISAAKGAKVCTSLVLVDDRRWITEAHEKKIQD